jgi:TPR repeat protein
LSWLEKAASHNNPQAQHTLGKLYAAGEVVPQDLAKAGQWLKAAAANGVKEAEEALAKLPSVPMPGGGTEKNPLGVVGENYGHGLQTLKQSWGGYRDAIRELDQATRN